MVNRKPFLKVRVHDVTNSPTLNGLCACFEDNSWRGKQFVSHLVKRHLIDFVFPPEEATTINSENGLESACKAAHAIYSTAKYENRGELGELILYSIMKEHFGARPLISKFYYKTHSNDTVKGFDSVHVLGTPESPQLWLGEVKFYKDLTRAIRDVIVELKDHFESAYLRSEFMFIENKMQGHDELSAAVRLLIDSANSLDDIRGSLHIPVFLTYESKIFNGHTQATKKFESEISQELVSGYQKFTNKELPKDINVHLILLPLKAKKLLVDEFDKRLKMMQEL